MNIKTLQYTNLLKLIIQNFTPTSGSLQLCYEIVNNILIVPEFIQSRFKCVSGVSRNNPVRQTISYIDYSVSATRFGFECVRFYADHTVNAVPRYIQPTAVNTTTGCSFIFFRVVLFTIFRRVKVLYLGTWAHRVAMMFVFCRR